MRRTEPATRHATVAATATTLVALLAMAAGVPALHGIADVRAATSQAALARGDANAARAMAAVVEAARELLAGSRTSAVLPSSTALDVTRPRQPLLAATVREEGPRSVPLAERLLDLPPPAC